MRFIPIGPEQKKRMLETVGAKSVDGLFAQVPREVLLDGPLDLPEGLSEMQLASHLRTLADRNRPATAYVSFLGAGCYDSYVPAVVDHVLGKPEFFTAYTPYQPEVSQGTLQAIFEFQSLVCRLTGLDVANASLYDGASALAEAAHLAARSTERAKVLVADTVHPEWRETLRTYAWASGSLRVEEFVSGGARVDFAELAAAAGDAAAVIVADPDFLGCLHDVEGVGRVAHEAGALLVVATDLSLLGVLEAPGAFGADVVIGEGQPLGSPQSLGGPGFGFFACREALLRRLPGRVAGRTTDEAGRTGFVLTLQTREQHIRRERATSNICSNHALAALAACVHLVALGSDGLRRTAAAAIAKAHYLHDALVSTGRFARIYECPFAREFALGWDGDVAEMQAAMLARGYLAGLDLGRFGMPGGVLFAVTEQRTRAEIDGFVEAVGSL